MIEQKLNDYLQKLEKWMNQWRLSLAPHKCQYLIFSKNKRASREDSFELRLYGELIPKDNSPTFLGIRFDPYMSFTNQVEYVLEKGKSRLNIIKILSHYNTWKINTTTLVRIYVALIRSLFVYMGYLYKFLSPNLKKSINALENNALRIILHKKRQECSVEDLHKLAKLKPLDVTLNDLNEAYLHKAFKLNNPIIEDLIEENKSYHLNLLINEDSSNEHFSRESIIEENEIIKNLAINNPKTIICASECLQKLVWPWEQNQSIMERHGILN
jgi:hypothetical protein